MKNYPKMCFNWHNFAGALFEACTEFCERFERAPQVWQ